MSNADVHPEIGVDTSDRLQFGIFIAVLLHAILIFGIGFGWQKQLHRENPLEFTLVNPTIEEISEVEAAEVLAQSAQLGGGSSELTQEATVESSSLETLEQIERLELGTAPEFAETASLGEEQLSSIDSKFDSVNPEKSEPETEAQQRLLQIQMQRSELMARIAEKEQELKSLRREVILDDSSLQAGASPEAEYILSVQSRIEAIGTSHFPQEALQRRIFGSLSVLITIAADGNLENIELLRSSGYPLLDQAAIEIARLAAPFAPFPDSLRSDYDRIHFPRVWRFSPTGSLNTESGQ